MTASMDSAWIALEAGQKAVLADPLMPEGVFLVLACLWLCEALNSLVCGFGVWFYALHFNRHFGLRLPFGLDTLHYPFQHRSRFGLVCFMCFHVRLKRTRVPATLIASRAFMLVARHLCSEKSTPNNMLEEVLKRGMWNQRTFMSKTCFIHETDSVKRVYGK